MSPFLVIPLNALFFATVGAVIAFALKRHGILALVLSAIVALSFPFAIDWTRAGFPLTREAARDLVNVLTFLAGDLLVLNCLPAVTGALLVIIARRLRHRRDAHIQNI